MKIVADENNPYVKEAFSTLGETILLPGKQITRDALRDANILVCRSTIKVDAELLESTAVKFVGTATIGMDHIDTAYLDKAGIHYCSAPGCNANSVADYVTAALFLWSEKRQVSLLGKTIGIVGCGNVGGRVVKRAEGLGMRILENDPPLARETGDPRYRPLEEILDADIITLHTPLTYNGQDATFHLVDDAFLRRMRRTAVLINTSRGAVVDGNALKSALTDHWISDALLDVWEGEPAPDPALVELALLATPHIAGHSFDGKVKGTVQVYQQACCWLGREPHWTVTPLLPETEFPLIAVDPAGRTDEDIIAEAVFKVYPIMKDDAQFRDAMKDANPEERARAFNALRKSYPRRREFSLSTVRLNEESARLAEKFHQISFQIAGWPRRTRISAFAKTALMRTRE